MKNFKHPNWQKDEKCPLCNTTEDKPVILVPIAGTSDGNLAEAQKIHEHCIQKNWYYYPDEKWIVAR